MTDIHELVGELLVNRNDSNTIEQINALKNIAVDAIRHAIGRDHPDINPILKVVAGDLVRLENVIERVRESNNKEWRQIRNEAIAKETGHATD